MIRHDAEVILSSGEALTAAEIFEGLARLAALDSAFPLLEPVDEAKAMISVTFEALDYAREKEIFE